MGFNVGRVLQRSFSIFAANFVPFTLMTGVIQLPAVLIALYPVLYRDAFFAWFNQGEVDVQGLGIWFAALISAAVLLRPLAAAAVTYGVLQQLRGQHATLGMCLRVGLARALPVIGVAIVAGLAMAAGMMALCVPGFMVMCGYYVATPAAVVEKGGVSESLSRSWDLTAGSRWQIFGIILIIGLISSAVDQAISAPFGDPMDTESHFDSGTIAVYALLSGITTVIVEALSATTAAVAYHDLRTEREGASSEDLARVFD